MTESRDPLNPAVSSAGAFFTSIAVWGVGVGCFAAALNNYLSDIHGITIFQRGVVEFFRELPGFALVFILALMHRLSDWRVLRLGTAISLLAALLLLAPTNKAGLTALVMLFSTGEHLVMPARQSLAMQVARPGREGSSLGLMTCVMSGGTILGSLLVAVVFWIGTRLFGIDDAKVLFRVVWILIALLLSGSVLSTYTKNAPNRVTKRPRLYFSRKFNKFYILELFYGARKQIFLTFAPYVLIKIYHLTTPQVAVLMGASALINMLGAPTVGRITDRFGYRAVMIWDTLILFWVALAYGYAGSLFPMRIAVWVVCGNYLLDGLISTASLATNIYVRRIAADPNELTSTLSTGISINHLISILIALVGGWIWAALGVSWLFTFSALMALANSAFAWSLPRHEETAS
ncbi:MAG: MFS transporter [Thermoguttaceae bacterium]|nr:MFS transporter [Thermoguttaceae bacterium]